jgi:hypothetical protein
MQMTSSTINGKLVTDEGLINANAVNYCLLMQPQLQLMPVILQLTHQILSYIERSNEES